MDHQDIHTVKRLTEVDSIRYCYNLGRVLYLLEVQLEYIQQTKYPLQVHRKLNLESIKEVCTIGLSLDSYTWL